MKLLSRIEYLFFSSFSTTPRVNESPSAAILFFSIICYVLFCRKITTQPPCAIIFVAGSTIWGQNSAFQG